MDRREPLPPEAAPYKRSRFGEAPAPAGGGAPALPAAAGFGAAPLDAATRAALEAAQRAALLKAQATAAAIAAAAGVKKAIEGAPAAAALAAAEGSTGARRTVLGSAPILRLDALGREVDEHGNVIEKKKDTSGASSGGVKAKSVFAGVAPSKREAAAPAAPANPYLAHRAAQPAASGASGAQPPAYVDPRLPMARQSGRQERGLRFVEEGTFTAAAEAMRAAAGRAAAYAAKREHGSAARPKFDKVAEAAAAAVAGGPSSAVASAPAPSAGAAMEDDAAPAPAPALAELLGLAPATAAPSVHLPAWPSSSPAQPGLEWWDAPFLPGPRLKEYSRLIRGGGGGGSGGGEGADAPAPFTASELALTNAKTFAYVQHPVPIVSEADKAAAAAPVAIPLMLTEKERKRLRRQKRAARLKELQDQQRLGLIPPPEPRVRLSNMMRVLASAAVADPSQIEAKVRAAMEARVKAGEAHNREKALTPEQRREKWRRKMTAHGPSGPDAALYRLSAFNHPKVRFKVEATARGLYCSGCVLQCRGLGITLVLVVGGTRAVRSFGGLMSRRIDWGIAHKGGRKRKPAGAGEAEGEGGSGSSDDEDDDDDSDDDYSEDEEDMSDGEEGSGGAAAALSALLSGGGASSGTVTARKFGSGPGSRCELVWKGVLPGGLAASAAAAAAASGSSTAEDDEPLQDFQFKAVATPAAARVSMEKLGLAHMWDAVVSSAKAAGDVSEDGTRPARETA